MELYRLGRRASKLALAVAIATPALADSEEFAAFARLDSNNVAPGQGSFLRLRSPLTSHPALLIFGQSPLGLPLGGSLPVLRVGPPYAAIQAVTTGSNGVLEIPYGFPASTPPGFSLYGQAFVVTSFGSVVDSNPLRLAPTASPATWTDASNQLPAAVATQLGLDVDFADLDRDGDRDALSVGPGDGARPLVLMNDGSGNFTEEGATRLPGEAQVACAMVEIADVDGDGDDDLFLGGAYDTVSPAPNLLLLNDGTANFVRDASFPVGAGRPLDGEWGDVDGDEDLDLVLVSLEEEAHTQSVSGAEVFRNTPGGFVAGQSFSSIPSSDPHYSGGGISLADFDNDGDLDAFVARSSGSTGWQNELWLNDGTGTFGDATADSLPPVPDNSHDVSILDVNGDGRLDVFVFNSVTSVPTGNNLLLNTGGEPPVFLGANSLLPSTLGPTTGIRFSGDVADVDSDGDTDVVVGIHALPAGPFPATDGEAVLLLNRGGIQGGVEGFYDVDPGFDFGPAYIDGDPSFEDVDGDGDLDLYFGNGGDLFEILPPVDRLYLNDQL